MGKSREFCAHVNGESKPVSVCMCVCVSVLCFSDLNARRRRHIDCAQFSRQQKVFRFDFRRVSHSYDCCRSLLPLCAIIKKANESCESCPPAIEIIQVGYAYEFRVRVRRPLSGCISPIPLCCSISIDIIFSLLLQNAVV